MSKHSERIKRERAAQEKEHRFNKVGEWVVENRAIIIAGAVMAFGIAAVFFLVSLL